MNVAEKTIAKIAKEQKKLDTLVAKRNEYNANVQAKLDSMNEDIKEQKAVIAELRKQEKAEKLEAISTMMNDKGISVDDLLNAVANNDLYAIQEPKQPNLPICSTTSTYLLLHLFSNPSLHLIAKIILGIIITAIIISPNIFNQSIFSSINSHHHMPLSGRTTEFYLILS